MKIEFKNGKTYELEDAGRDGILVFKDSVFSIQFDQKEDTSVWSKCTLKKFLRLWWDENAPDALKDKYDVNLLSIKEVFDQKEINWFYNGTKKKRPKSNQLPLFANDWKARIKRPMNGKNSCWWWLRSPSPREEHFATSVCADGSLFHVYIGYGVGLVPACYPKNKDPQNV